MFRATEDGGQQSYLNTLLYVLFQMPQSIATAAVVHRHGADIMNDTPAPAQRSSTEATADTPEGSTSSRMALAWLHTKNRCSTA